MFQFLFRIMDYCVSRLSPNDDWPWSAYGTWWDDRSRYRKYDGTGWKQGQSRRWQGWWRKSWWCRSRRQDGFEEAEC